MFNLFENILQYNIFFLALIFLEHLGVEMTIFS